ncbi:MAG: hypothetical protein QGH58_07510, partial [Arenicellales bacterium]|nr:hypothetical protein [Arenicellales bacterium]
MKFYPSAFRGEQQSRHVRPNVLYISNAHLAVLRAERDAHPNVVFQRVEIEKIPADFIVAHKQ